MHKPKTVATQNFRLSHLPASRTPETLAEVVREGLCAEEKFLHPKFFYDEHGSLLFDKICDTPEYYPTRTEWSLLQSSSTEIIRRVEPRNILEYGSGTSRKTRALLDAWSEQGVTHHTHVYWPMDVSGELLEDVGRGLSEEYENLFVHALVGDYTAGLGQLPNRFGTTLGLFLGSTLGNFPPEEAGPFLCEITDDLQGGDYFLLGTDLHKDSNVLEAAYNDSQGVTAAFNLNVLTVINRELNGGFDLNKFTHVAFYNESKRQVEMHLKSDVDQVVPVDALGMQASFAKGETIFTEISRKFLPLEVDELLRTAGLHTVKRFVHDEFPYALTLAVKA